MRTNKDKQLLRHILEYCSRVEEAVTRIGTEENLLADAFSQDALAMPLAQIGELVRILSDEFKTAYGEIPWRKISGMRNHLIHGYGEIDWTEIWDTAISDIPEFKEKCAHIYNEISNQ